MGDHSEENSHKLNRIIQLLEGQEDAPGLLHRQSAVEEILFGSKGHGGLVNKVNIMWRAHVWLLCTLSGVAGYLIKSVVEKVIKP